jgi:4-hydroxythreonine-4-phosphate dehydrogenase
MSASAPIIVLSSGEPAGIGPDICLALAREPLPVALVVLGDPAVLEARARLLALDVAIERLDSVATAAAHRAGTLQMLPIEARREVVPGQLDPANAPYVLAQLETGADLCTGGAAAALVTAPVQKSVINEAGFPFSGHTEFLAARTGAAQPVMLLVGGNLRVALATTHLPLRAVADAISGPRLERIARILDADLRSRFGLLAPRILVLGLNPHAGEHGVLGDEELRVIGPAVAQLRRRGIDAIGPVSADTAFTAESLERCDVVLAMYHDQGLPVIKTASFGEIVNVTLGLPIVRTSVDHGTALPLAGTGRARHASLRRAVELAAELAAR